MSTNAAGGAGLRRRRVFLFGFLALLVAVAAVRSALIQRHSDWLASADIEQLAAAAPKRMDDVALFERLGVRAREAEQWPRAMKAFQHACELAPDRPLVWIGWARSTYEVAGYQAADAIFSDFLRRHPESAEVYKERAAMRRVAKRTELAWQDADRATKLAPRSGEAWALRGDLSLDQGIAGEGEASFRKARELMPGSPWPYVGLYQAFLAEKKFPDALDMARTISRRFPSVLEANLYLGEALIENANGPADLEKAREALLALKPRFDELRKADQFSYLVLLGRTYFNQGRWADARSNFEKAREIIPDNPDALFLLGRTYRRLGDEKRATETLDLHRTVYEDVAQVRKFVAQINQTPDDARLRLEFARWYAKRGATQNAAIQYEEMIARNLDAETAKRELRAIQTDGQGQ